MSKVRLLVTAPYAVPCPAGKPHTPGEVYETNLTEMVESQIVSGHVRLVESIAAPVVAQPKSRATAPNDHQETQ